MALIWLKNRKTELIIFAMLFLAGAAFYHPIEYDNTKSRYLLISAVVDYGTLNIDIYQAQTIDKSEWNGHYYSNKAPGASFLGIPVHWILRNLTPLKEFSPKTWLDMYIIRVVTTTLLFALLGVVMFRLAQFCGAFPRQAFLMVIAYGFGSIALLHATMFSGHQIAACLSFFSFALLVRSFSNERTSMIANWGYGFIAGLLAGFAVVTDYTAIVISICLAVYTIASRLNIRLKAGFILGACVCVIILAAYNMVCFGNPFSFSYAHQSFDVFRKGAAQGICGVGIPKMGAMVNLLFSPSRGIFFIMPVLLLSFWGIAQMIGREHHKREAILITAIAIGYFLFIAGFYNWHGGATFGPRYLVPMLPFLAFPLAFIRWRPYIFWLLFIPSCAQVGISVIGVPHVPHLIANPIVELIIPSINCGYTALNAGMLLGLEWPWSFMAVIAFIVLLGILAFCGIYQETSLKVKDISMLSMTLLMLWICIIVAMLAVIRTDPPAKAHFFRSKIFEDAADYFNMRGITYGKQGRYQPAIEDFNRAIRLKPDFALAYMNRGVTYLNQSNKELSCSDAQKACELGNCKFLEDVKVEGLCR